MILVIREDGEALNLEQAQRLSTDTTPTGPRSLTVRMADNQWYVVEDFSTQDLIDHCTGRFASVQVIRKYWRAVTRQQAGA